MHGARPATVKKRSPAAATTLSREEEAYYFFHKHDKDNSGTIGIEELRACFDELGVKPLHKRTPDQVDAWMVRQFEKLDVKRVGVITFDEFKRYYSEVIAQTHHKFDETYEVGPLLGKGAFGTVVAARKRADKTSVAVKRIRKDGVNIGLLHNEISIWGVLKHKHLLQLLDVYETNDEVLLVMERMRGGDLFTALSSMEVLVEKEAADITRQMIEAVGYLHDNGVVHCDLKPGNILLVEPYKQGTPLQLKICDFGLSQVLQANKGGEGSDAADTAPLHVVCGTPEYFAPELVDLSHGAHAFRPAEGYDSAVDRWALGCIIYELIAGHPPYEAKDEQVLFFKIVENMLEFPKVFEQVSPDAEALIRGLMASEPSARLTCREALDNPWLSAHEEAKTTNIMTDYVQQSRGRQQGANRKAVPAQLGEEEL